MKKLVVLFILLIISFCISGCSIKKTAELSDAEKFANEYSVSNKNSFYYATIDEVLELFEGKSGILFLGDSDCEWSNYGVKALNNVLEKNEIEKVYYFNPKISKSKKSKKYDELCNFLKIEDSSLPTLYYISEGRVIDYVDYQVNNDSDISEKSMSELENQYFDLISQYLKEYSTDL